ncbi:nuclear RNA export factor 2-like [Megaptera novaeangliae]
MKAEGPAGQQYSPGDRCWYLGQGGGNGGGEKWLASGHTLREGPREFPDQLDVECGRKRAHQAPSESIVQGKAGGRETVQEAVTSVPPDIKAPSALAKEVQLACWLLVESVWWLIGFGKHEREYSDGGRPPQGRKKGCSSFPGNSGKRSPHYEHGGGEPQPSHLQEDDGNVVKRDVQEDPEILSRMKYDRTWLMNSIQRHCSVPFTPVDFHFVKNGARFFVQEASTASALMDVSYKICDEESRKIPVFVSPSAAPYSVRYKLKPEEMEQLKLTLIKRFNISKQALDLQRLCVDPDLVGHDIDIILNRRSCMSATLQIIKKNFPELLSLNLSSNKLYRLDGLSDIIQMAPTVKILNLSKNELPPHISQLKSVWELSKMQGLKLEELWLQGNPLCGTFPDWTTYVRAIRDRFPKLLRLHPGPLPWSPLLTSSSLLQDGQELPSPVTVNVDTPCVLKPCKGSYFGCDELKSLVLQFLQQYYSIHDCGDRQGLVGAYHEETCFSLTIPFHPEDPAPSSLCEYFKDIRNMKKLKDPHLRVQLLKHTKRDIVHTLCVLPKTQHDLSSFVVDTWSQTERMLCFSVNGVFKEMEGSSQDCVCAFTRTFIATPASYSSLFIMNDELFVWDVNPKKTQSAVSIPVPTPSTSSMPSFYWEQQQMVQAFSTQSGMNLQWSQKEAKKVEAGGLRMERGELALLTSRLLLSRPKPQAMPMNRVGDLADKEARVTF